MGGLKKVDNLYSMHGLIRIGCQELGDFIFHAALHGAKKVIFGALYLNCFIDKKEKNTWPVLG